MLIGLRSKSLGECVNETFLVQGGKYYRIGSGLQLIEAADFDGDGVSELLFQYDAYNRNGYVLLHLPDRGRIEFLCSHHQAGCTAEVSRAIDRATSPPARVARLLPPALAVLLIARRNRMDLSRREFVGAAAAAVTVPKIDTSKILNYNSNMEYRRLGKTNLMVSAVCLGGHWKRVANMMEPGFKGEGYLDQDYKNLSHAGFIRNRADIVERCMSHGMNYVDACSPQEILAYSKVLQGRRDRMYFGFSWHVREPRYDEWRTAKRLMEGFEMSLKEAHLDYADVWRISLPMEGVDYEMMLRVEEATVGALDKAKQQGKARFTGVSTHNRTWLESVIRQHPKQIEVALFPYTAATRELPDESIFETIKKNDVGVFGIKPFADNSLFAGNGAMNSPSREEDDRRARLAIRYILQNPAITAPIAGLVNVAQVDNAAKAIEEYRRERTLNKRERAELDNATRDIWARLRPDHTWLQDWAEV